MEEVPVWTQTFLKDAPDVFHTVAGFFCFLDAGLIGTNSPSSEFSLRRNQWPRSRREEGVYNNKKRLYTKIHTKH